MIDRNISPAGIFPWEVIHARSHRCMFPYMRQSKRSGIQSILLQIMYKQSCRSDSTLCHLCDQCIGQRLIADLAPLINFQWGSIAFKIGINGLSLHGLSEYIDIFISELCFWRTKTAHACVSMFDYRPQLLSFQTTDGYFNKGALFNAGFTELYKRFKKQFRCIVLQDVDVLPETDCISYLCKDYPWHLASHIDRFGYK